MKTFYQALLVLMGGTVLVGIFAPAADLLGYTMWQWVAGLFVVLVVLMGCDLIRD